jgi:hypothetical protein
MAGTWIVNVFLGCVGFTIVFASAYTNNSFMTSLIRGLVAFVSFFLIAYIFRWMIHFIMSDAKGNTTKNSVADYHATTGTKQTSQDDESVTVEELQQSLDSLSEEEVKLASRYIKELLNQKD